MVESTSSIHVTSPATRPAAAGIQLHRGFVAAGGILQIAALGTDFIYYETALWQWANFSAWLITGGLIVTLVAVLLLLIDFATGRAGRLNLGSFTLVGAAALLSLVNAFVHSRDAWTSVVPQGILLSAVCAVLLLCAGARGWSVALRRPTGAGRLTVNGHASRDERSTVDGRAVGERV
jgi:uncharacterized membrane protein